jgi:ABC-type polysaccharide/polyol phosphate transport system ATPase subunit
MAVIEVASVSKAFRVPAVRRDTIREHALAFWQPRRFQRLQVLDSVEFELHKGETLGLMGRNGSGKSTLLKIVCGIYQPDRGQVAVRAAVTPILELGIGWNSELDAIDNVFVAGTLMGLSVAEVRRGMEQIISFAGLERFANLKVKHYSSGMAARLAYAVAFQAVRDVLVLDEIFAVGDAGFKARCEERFLTLRAQGHSVLVVSHDPRIITTFCDRALLLDRGRIVMDGAPTDVARRYLSIVA